jgi:hypothetical protein
MVEAPPADLVDTWDGCGEGAVCCRDWRWRGTSRGVGKVDGGLRIELPLLTKFETPGLIVAGIGLALAYDGVGDVMGGITDPARLRVRFSCCCWKVKLGSLAMG